MRGKLRHRHRQHAGRRIIPARAGQTAGHSRIGAPCTDHPRACGANCGIDIANTQADGSSPRVRGKRSSSSLSARRSRIIPARAGQTSCSVLQVNRRADHPRACGANDMRKLRSFAKDGSSPRVRGKHRRVLAGRLATRIIPARAGQTTAHRDVTRTASDHPRACGANTLLCLETCYRSGSSPRVRGKRLSAHTVRIRLRIIPARAGQTA